MVSRIESEVAGRIIEVRVRRGDTVQAGQTLAIVEPEDAAMQSVVYFDARTAKQIRPGMEAQISPTDIKREEYGFIKGTVQFVGEGPVSIEKVRQDLANQALAQEIYGQTAKIEIRAKLNENANTPSGLEWSSSIGPAFQINSNTRINVEVVVDRRPPYTYVLPIIRGAVGVS
jgi:HlyD family secretion protein